MRINGAHAIYGYHFVGKKVPQGGYFPILLVIFDSASVLLLFQNARDVKIVDFGAVVFLTSTGKVGAKPFASHVDIYGYFHFYSLICFLVRGLKTLRYLYASRPQRFHVEGT